DGEAMSCRAEPRRDEKAAVIAVAVRRVVLDPSHLAVDQEVDLANLRARQMRKREPADAMGEDGLPVERRAHCERRLRRVRRRRPERRECKATGHEDYEEAAGHRAITRG